MTADADFVKISDAGTYECLKMEIEPWLAMYCFCSKKTFPMGLAYLTFALIVRPLRAY